MRPPSQYARGWDNPPSTRTERNLPRRPLPRGLPRKIERRICSKLDGGLQELDETAYWLEILAYSQIFTDPEVHALLAETDELTASS